MNKVIIAAYHPIVVKGISAVIQEKLSVFKIIASATNAKTFLSLLDIHKPDTAIVDVSITWKSEIDILDEIHRIHPKVKLFFVSTHPFDGSVQKYLIKRAEKKFKALENEMPILSPASSDHTASMTVKKSAAK